MGWIWLDDKFFEHPNIVDLPPAAKLLYVGGLAWCNQHHTDGHITTAALKIIAAWTGTSTKAARHLVDQGRWHKTGDGYDVHNYLEYQQSAEAAEKAREASRERQRRFKNRRRTPDSNGVTGPPGNGVTGTVTGTVTNAQSNTVNNGDNPQPTSKTSLCSEDQLSRDQVAETRNRHPSNPPEPAPIDPLARKLHELLTANGGRGQAASAAACAHTIAHLRLHVDSRVIDERIGYAATLDQPPRTARYLAAMVQHWMAERGEQIPDLPPLEARTTPTARTTT